MKIDLEKVDAKIRMLEAIKEIASNPEMAALLSDVVVPEASVITTPVVRKNGAAKPPAGKYQKGALQTAVLEAARQWGGPFDAYSLTNRMVENGPYKFTAAKPALAVNDVLRSLEQQKREIRLHAKGHGSRPNLYVYVGSPSTTGEPIPTKGIEE